MQTLPQEQNFNGTSAEDFLEAHFYYTLLGFQELVKEKRWGAEKVWKALDSETKAHLRRIMVIEQLIVEGRE